jgi:hypothetical protein
MNVTTTSITALLVAIAIAAFGGCEGISQTSEADRRIAAEQVVIKAYSDEVPKVDALLASFLEAWKKANEKTDLKAYKDDLEANVLPALDAFVAAAEAMPLGSTQLKAIHAPLLSAYQDARAAHRSFLANVSAQTMEAEYAKVLDAMDKVSKAEQIYLDSLQAYYKENRVDLQQAP